MHESSSSNRRDPALVGVTALLCCLAALALGPVRAPAQAGFRDCGDIPSQYTLGIKTRGVSCREAKKVIRIYTKRIIKNLQHDWSLTVRGFHCDLGHKYYYGETHHCNAGSRVIRFRRGTR